MSTSHASRVARPSRKLEKLRPPKSVGLNRHSTFDARSGTVEDIMMLTDSVASHLANGNYDQVVQSHIKSLHSVLKMYGSKLEAIYKDQLDRAFVSFRNGCRDDALDYVSRLCLLELIELRAMQWAPTDANSYYKHKLNHPDIDTASLTPTAEPIFGQPLLFPVSPTAATPAPLMLSPGELLKSSGKYPAPTKVLGKNYCKDEIVIRNSDSGKVMGIKGRRVHMIEELSETVISFQRVNQGAKERLVQITGPTEDKITYAKQLMEDTIRRNASPVRVDGDLERLGSSSSLNSSTSDDSLLPPHLSRRSNLLHSYSTNDATFGEYKYTVTVGDDSIKVTGTNIDLVRVAKLVLDEYFSPDVMDESAELDDNQEVFEPVDQIANNINDIPFEVDPVPAAKSEKPKVKAVLSYSAAYIIYLVDSPLSYKMPEELADILFDITSIAKKAPLKRLTAATILQSRLRCASLCACPRWRCTLLGRQKLMLFRDSIDADKNKSRREEEEVNSSSDSIKFCPVKLLS